MILFKGIYYSYICNILSVFDHLDAEIRARFQGMPGYYHLGPFKRRKVKVAVDDIGVYGQYIMKQ